MQFIPLGLYVLLSVILAYAGRNTRIGAFGVFLCCVIFTPLLVGLVFALVRPALKKASSGPSQEG